MTQLVPISTPPLDPNVIFGMGRVVSGIVRSGAVTFDEDFPEYGRWIYVGQTGSISYVKWDGSTETLAAISDGVWHPIFAKRINSAGTTMAASALRWGN